MSLATFWYPFLNKLNRLVSQLMYSVKPLIPCPLPPNGPVLLVSDHSTLGDPLVLLATAGRPLHFLVAREIYKRQGWGKGKLHGTVVVNTNQNPRELDKTLDFRCIGKSY